MDSGVAARLSMQIEVNNALSLEVYDFRNSDDKFNKDNFVANTTALDRVFRVLSRFELIKGYEPKEFSEEFLALLD